MHHILKIERMGKGDRANDVAKKNSERAALCAALQSASRLNCTDCERRTAGAARLGPRLRLGPTSRALQPRHPLNLNQLFQFYNRRNVEAIQISYARLPFLLRRQMRVERVGVGEQGGAWGGEGDGAAVEDDRLVRDGQDLLRLLLDNDH